MLILLILPDPFCYPLLYLLTGGRRRWHRNNGRLGYAGLLWLGRRRRWAMLVDVSDYSNIIIMGNSQIDTEIAAKLDAIQLPSIVNDNGLDELWSTLERCRDHVTTLMRTPPLS